MKKPQLESNWHALEMLLLQETFKKIGQDGKPDACINTMLHLMSELLGLNRGRVVLLQDDGNLQIKYSYGLSPKHIENGRYQPKEGVTGTVFSNGHSLMIQDIHSDPLFLGRAVKHDELPQEKLSFIAIPLKANHRTFGVLACHRLRMSERTLDSDMTLLNMLATLTSQLLNWQISTETMTQSLKAQNDALRNALHSHNRHYGIIGSSQALLKAIGELEKVSNSNANVLLLGESGTGKELFARALHTASPRVNQPFIKVNCAAIPESLFESELFGSEKGAYTGSTKDRAGLFEQANGGTIFLDEIGELPLAVQSKILRTLQEGTITRLGGSKEIKVDVRIVTATHRNLAEEVQMGKFRQDLYYRLYVIPILLPSLRERRSDIPELVAFFLNRINQENHRSVNLTANAVLALQHYDWPGNIRQLQNVLERLVLLATSPIVDETVVEQLLGMQHEENVKVNHFSSLSNQTQSQYQPQFRPQYATQPVHTPTPQFPTGTTNPYFANAQTSFAQNIPTEMPHNAYPFDANAYSIRPYMQANSHTLEELNAALQRARGNKTQAAALLGMTPRQFSYRWKTLQGDNPANT